MKKTFIVLCIIFGVMGIILTILPLGTLALTVVIPAMIFAFLAVFFSKEKPGKLPKILVLFTVTLFFTVLAKEVFTSDKVTQDTKFMQEKEKSLQDAQHDLEEIEGLQ